MLDPHHTTKNVCRHTETHTHIAHTNIPSQWLTKCSIIRFPNYLVLASSISDTVGNRWGTSQANVDSKEAYQNALGPISACVLRNQWKKINVTQRKAQSGSVRFILLFYMQLHCSSSPWPSTGAFLTSLLNLNQWQCFIPLYSIQEHQIAQDICIQAI